MRAFQQHIGQFGFLPPECTGGPGSDKKTVLDRGGHGFNWASREGRASRLPRVGRVVMANPSLRLCYAPLEGVEDLPIEIAAVVIGDLRIADRGHDFGKRPLEAGAALWRGKILA